MSCVIVAIYNHPELYPPTLNAIEELSVVFDEVKVVQRPNYESVWQYPENVMLSQWSYLEPEPVNFSTFDKTRQFLAYVKKIKKLLRSKKPELVLIYDYMALYAYQQAKKGVSSKAKIWYHNHDVPDYEKLRKYSIGWFARNVHRKMFPKIDVFSIPSEERLSYFPLKLLANKAEIVPNYPALRKFSDMHISKDKEVDLITIIYQGQIDAGHGIENIVDILGEEVLGKRVELLLFGKGDDDFIQELREKVKVNSTEGYFHFKGFVPYKELFQFTMKAHIGLAMAPSNINYGTAGQASNKIYEYAACGLPILYSRNEHYMKYLDKYSWAFDTSGEKEDILGSIESIIRSYPQLVENAHRSFKEELNFENSFCKVLNKFVQ